MWVLLQAARAQALGVLAAQIQARAAKTVEPAELLLSR
jgi:hypothetical protein